MRRAGSSSRKSGACRRAAAGATSSSSSASAGSMLPPAPADIGGRHELTGGTSAIRRTALREYRRMARELSEARDCNTALRNGDRLGLSGACSARWISRLGGRGRGGRAPRGKRGTRAPPPAARSLRRGRGKLQRAGTPARPAAPPHNLLLLHFELQTH